MGRCDVALFFNYARINRAIGASQFDAHLDALFGEKELARLRSELPGAGEDVFRREDLVLDALEQALRGIGAKFFLPYRFRMPDGRTSHHLVFVTTKRMGYDTMKKSMARFSAKTHDDIPMFEFVQGTPRSEQLSFLDIQTLTPPRHFPFSVRQLADTIYNRYRGRKIGLVNVFDAMNVGTPYVLKNFKDAAIDLRARTLATLVRSTTGVAPKANQCPDDTEIIL